MLSPGVEKIDRYFGEIFWRSLRHHATLEARMYATPRRAKRALARNCRLWLDMPTYSSAAVGIDDRKSCSNEFSSCRNEYSSSGDDRLVGDLHPSFNRKQLADCSFCLSPPFSASATGEVFWSDVRACLLESTSTT